MQPAVRREAPSPRVCVWGQPRGAARDFVSKRALPRLVCTPRVPRCAYRRRPAAAAGCVQGRDGFAAARGGQRWRGGWAGRRGRCALCIATCAHAPPACVRCPPPSQTACLPANHAVLPPPQSPSLLCACRRYRGRAHGGGNGAHGRAAAHWQHPGHYKHPNQGGGMWRACVSVLGGCGERV